MKKVFTISLPAPSFDVATVQAVNKARGLVNEFNDGNFHHGDDVTLESVVFVGLKVDADRADEIYHYTFMLET